MPQTMVTVVCAWCEEEVEKVASEVKRQIRNGKTRFFCSASHAAKFRNAIRKDRRKEVTKICPNCNEPFETMTGAKSATFCSRSCASAGSVTEARRQAGRTAGKQNVHAIQTIEAMARGLRRREAWKYEELRKLLDFRREEHQFEYALPGTRHIFDLVLPDRGVLVEFDGKYHRDGKQADADTEKAAAAERLGWKVLRVDTPDNQVIEASTLYPVLEEDK